MVLPTSNYFPIKFQPMAFCAKPDISDIQGTKGLCKQRKYSPYQIASKFFDFPQKRQETIVEIGIKMKDEHTKIIVCRVGNATIRTIDRSIVITRYKLTRTRPQAGSAMDGIVVFPIVFLESQFHFSINSITMILHIIYSNLFRFYLHF